MEKKIITFTADEQSLRKTGGISNYSSNKVSYIEAVFELGENWQGFDAVRAIWYNKSEIIATVLSDGHCTVPYEVLTDKGQVKVNLVGSISENDVLTDRLTSYPTVAFIVDAEAKVNGSNTQPITPSQFEQFVEAVKEDADRAEQGASDAETYANNAETSADNSLSYSQNAEGSAIRASGYALDASASATSAEGYAQNASESATSAENYASDAEDARDEIRNMSANATTLPAGSSATASYSDGVLSLGIPRGDKGATGAKGDKGDTGATPNLTIGTVTTLDPSESATATITGTDENPVLNLGLPKGEQGEVSLDELLQNTIVQTNSDSVPYNFRPTPSCGSLEYDEIVGASVGWNQLADPIVMHASGTENGVTFTKDGGKLTVSGTATANIYARICSQYTPTSGHKMLFIGAPSAIANVTFYDDSAVRQFDGKTTYALINASGAQVNFKMKIISGNSVNGTVIPQIIDLTLMLGSTIADYVYSLETATAGAGVAWLKSHFPKAFDNGYQPYSSGEIQNVHGLSAHVMKDSSDNIIGNYPLDSTLTLRGIYKMDANHNLYADGDEYTSDGTVTRKYGIVDLGTLNWARGSDTYFQVVFANAKRGTLNLCVYGKDYTPKATYDEIYRTDKTIFINPNGVMYIRDDSYTDASTFKTAMSGVYLVYELATPTTETADPYTNPQNCEQGGTEEYVGAEIAVGHKTQYPMTLGDTMPKANGTYTMSVTIANGKKTINWT